MIEKDIPLEELKARVLDAFAKNQISSKEIEIIKSKKSELKLRRFLNSLQKQHRKILDDLGINYSPPKKKREEKNSKKFRDYKFKVLNTLAQKSEVPVSIQLEIQQADSKIDLLNTIKKSLRPEDLKILKDNRVEPFYKNSGYTKIFFNPMGNKR